MEYFQLEQYHLNSPAIQLLRSRNASLVISFLYEQFQREPKPSLRYIDLRDALSRYLDQINEYEPNRYPSSADNYLNQWINDNLWLRRVRSDAPEDYLVELTVHTQRVLSWMEELEQRTFVGTESRFLQILNLLEQLVVRGTSDKEVRLAQLHAEKTRIEAEIETIERTGQVDQYDSRQIRERFYYAGTLATQLLRDFGAVEESFKEIAQQVQLSQLQPDVRKGVIVKQVLDADVALRDSDVGKSFYAFWSYLHLPGHQEQLDERIEKIFRLEDIGEEERRNTILRDLLGHLIRAGLKVDQSNQRLAEQLRGMLDEAHIEESRRIKILTSEIKGLALKLRDELQEDDRLLEVEGLPETHLSMEQALFYPKETVYYDELPEIMDVSNYDLSEIASLIDYFYVDAARLREQIEAALEVYPAITLTDLLILYPAEKGLSEIVTYLQIAADDDHHQIDMTQYEVITIPTSQQVTNYLRLKVPQIVFQKFSEASK